jgi:hypothetical protein
MFEQLGLPPLTTLPGQSRTQVSLKEENYMDSITAQASGIIDASIFEIGLKASQRLYLSYTDEGNLLQSALAPYEQTASVEIARSFTSVKLHHARLGIEAIQFFPQNEFWLKIGLDTGIKNTPESPWDFALHLAYFTSVPRIGDFLQAFGETARVYKTDWGYLRCGGFIYWTYNDHDDSSAGIYEHMLFSFGPSAEWQTTSSGVFRVSVPLRLWIDREVTVRSDQSVVVGFPSEVAAPDLMLSWSYLF